MSDNPSNKRPHGEPPASASPRAVRSFGDSDAADKPITVPGLGNAAVKADTPPPLEARIDAARRIGTARLDGAASHLGDGGAGADAEEITGVRTKSGEPPDEDTAIPQGPWPVYKATARFQEGPGLAGLPLADDSASASQRARSNGRVHVGLGRLATVEDIDASPRAASVVPRWPPTPPPTLPSVSGVTASSASTAGASAAAPEGHRFKMILVLGASVFIAVGGLAGGFFAAAGWRAAAQAGGTKAPAASGAGATSAAPQASVVSAPETVSAPVTVVALPVPSAAAAPTPSGGTIANAPAPTHAPQTLPAPSAGIEPPHGPRVPGAEPVRPPRPPRQPPPAPTGPIPLIDKE